MKRLILAALLAATLSGCGSTFRVAGTLDMEPSFTLDAQGNEKDPSPGDPCEGVYSTSRTMSGGERVIVRAADGTKVGFSELRTPTVVKDAGGGLSCRFRFAVDDVKGDGDLFSVQIADSDPFDFKRADAETLELTY